MHVEKKLTLINLDANAKQSTTLQLAGCFPALIQVCSTCIYSIIPSHSGFGEEGDQKAKSNSDTSSVQLDIMLASFVIDEKKTISPSAYNTNTNNVIQILWRRQRYYLQYE